MSCKKRQRFTATFFPLFCGSEILFIPSHSATRLCLIQCITNLTEVVSNFETDIDKKKFYNSLEVLVQWKHLWVFPNH